MRVGSFKYWLAILLLYTPIYAFNQAMPVNFYKITNEQGLSQAVVNTLYKDHEGFLWIGTDGGLNRFDGQEIKAFYTSSKDRFSFSGHEVYAITGDDKGRIFCGLYSGGVCYLDKNTYHFYNINLNQPGEGAPPSVYGLLYDSGFIWVRKSKGISRIDSKTLAVESFNSADFVDKRIVESVDMVEAGGFIWFGSTRKGLLRIRKDGSIAKGNVWDSRRYGIGVTGILKEDKNLLTVVSEKGIFRVLIKGEDFEVVPLLLDEKSFNHSNKILWDEMRQCYWIGTDEKGVVLVDKKGEILRKITSLNINDNLSSNLIYALLKDQENTIFLGTARGVNVTSPSTYAFNNYQNVLRSAKGLKHPIYAVYELSPQKLLLGCYNGIFVFDTRNYSIKEVPFHPARPTSKIVYHFQPFKDIILVCTYSGVFEMRQLNGTFSITTRQQKYPELNILKDLRIATVLPISDSIAYIGTINSGMFKWNYSKHRLTSIARTNLSKTDNKQPLDNVIRDLVLTRNGKQLIVCCQDGFSLYDLKSETFQHFRGGDNYPFQHSGVNIKGACDDGANIWIASYGRGLHKYNKATGLFTRYTTDEDLPNNSLYAVVPDGDNNLWLPTNNGLARLNISNNQIRSFFKEEGLPDNEFNASASYRANSGLLYFSTIDGLLSVNPKLVYESRFSPSIVVTSFISNMNGRDSIYNTYGQKQFILPQGYRNVRLKYAALTFGVPSKVRYKVKMSGVDNDWVQMDHGNEVIYHKLRPGTYTFSILSTNSSGIWSNKSYDFKIVVEPMWFETWFFFWGSILVMLIFTYFFFRALK